MTYLCGMLSDYINQGYRIYRIQDLPIQQLVSKLPAIQRSNRLEITIVEGVVLVKNTNKYDKPKNPYL